MNAIANMLEPRRRVMPGLTRLVIGGLNVTCLSDMWRFPAGDDRKVARRLFRRWQLKCNRARNAVKYADHERAWRADRLEHVRQTKRAWYLANRGTPRFKAVASAAQRRWEKKTNRKSDG